MSTTESDLIAPYLQGVTALRQAVEGMTHEQLLARPVAGKWSTLEVVSHIADFESVYADRIKRIIATDRPVLLDAGHVQYAANLGYQDRDIEEELAVIEATRRSLATTLKAVGLASLDRVGVYRNGQGVEEDRSAGRLFTLITGHIPHHLTHVREKRTALGLANPENHDH